ncbi:hypothetical protein JCM11251_000585 [Rhodosporidiobolus azoricus]
MPSISIYQCLLPDSLLVHFHHCYDHVPPIYFAEFEDLYQQISNKEKRARQLYVAVEKCGDGPPPPRSEKGTKRFLALLFLLRARFLRSGLRLYEEIHALLLQPDPLDAQTHLAKLPSYPMSTKLLDHFTS